MKPPRPLRSLCVLGVRLFVAPNENNAETTGSSPRALRSLLVTMLALLSLTTAVYAGSLDDYRSRVHDAMLAVDSMAASVAESDPESESETIEEVRSLLPVTENIERSGSTITVSNEWLHRALDDYQRIAESQSQDDRAAMLRRIAERLLALEGRLGEPSNAATTRDKDAEKGRLANILRSPDYTRKASEGGALSRLIEQIFKWIRDLFPSSNPVQPGTSRGPSRIVQVAIFAVALFVIFFIVWKYWVRRRDRIKPVSLKEARVVLGERIEPDQTAFDLLAEAELLARQGELRSAIRKAYIALLCELGDRRVIRLAQHKTNRDYLRAVRAGGPPQLYEEMRPLTLNFERHWYGLEEAAESDWSDFRTRCRQALNFK